jgi:hypothetical protein
MARTGRPRIHENDAAKAKAYRQRLKDRPSGDYPTTTFSPIKAGEKIGAGIFRWEGPGREPLRVNERD